MNSLFQGVPRRRIPRSVKYLSHGNKTTMNVGTLYPVSVVDVLPDDVFKVVCKNVSRVSSTFVKPIMDNLVCEIHAFFTPLTLGFTDAHKVFGNPSPSAYENGIRISLPSYSDVAETVTVSGNTVNERLGCPVGTYDANFDCLEPRLFACIYDEYFRNESIVDPMYIQKGACSSSELPNNNPWSPSNYNGQLPKVSKRRDYFTSCVPRPQKGDQVKIPIQNLTGNTTLQRLVPENGVVNDFVLESINDGGMQYTPTTMYGNYTFNSPYSQVGYTYTQTQLPFTPNDASKVTLGLNPDNFGLALGSVLGQFSVEDMRLASALQRMLEIDAMYGSSYHDYLLGHFDTMIRDDVVQRPEYLGGGLIPITIQQVNQTSQGNENSPLANVAGTSLTNGYFKFSRKFKQHGKLFIVAFIRQFHTYQQGMPKRRMRLTREEFYDPLTAHLGEQPVYRSEIYANGSDDLKGDVFGYNVAYADYQFLPDTVTGQMRSGVENSLDIWHLADYYQNAPALVKSFIEESPVNIDRALSVESSELDNFIADFRFDIKAIRKMPENTTPLNYGV